jgi:hypothetical protein
VTASADQNAYVAGTSASGTKTEMALRDVAADDQRGARRRHP